MTKIHIAHLGSIIHNDVTIINFVRPQRHILLYDINSWFFDYFYANGLPIQSIPPLDDWTQSHEHINMWSVPFPSSEWVVRIVTEPLAFV